MPEVKAEDLEELYVRRMTDQVVERTEQIIQRRYLWISVTSGLAFAVVSWLGGATMISDFVKARVDDAVNKQSQTIHDVEIDAVSATARMKARLAEVDERLQSTQDTEKKLAQQLYELKGEADSFKESLGQIVSATNTLRKNSDDIALLKTSVADLTKLSSTVAQLQSLLYDFAKQSPSLASKLLPAEAQSQAGQITENLVATNKKLAEATVFVQFSGAVSRAQIDAIRSTLKRNLEISAPPTEREISVPPAERVASKVREVRYFYDGDKDLSDKVAAAAQSALSEGGFGDNIIVKSTPWSRPRMSTKPPK